MPQPLAQDSPASSRLDAAALELESALQLIGRAGVELPPRERDPQAWMQALIDALCDLSSRDALTGLVNRRQFELSLEREIDRVARSGEPALVLVLDIDHFKRVNDTHGHAAGDAVIRSVARLLQDSVRPMDTVARIGGEEYGIVLPNCAPAFGQAVAERIRRRVHGASIDIGMNQTLAVTLSVGGAFAPQWVRSSARLWTERADQQLYRAKTEGRNRACLDMPPVSVVSAEEKGMLFALPVVPDDSDEPDTASTPHTP